MNRVLYVCSTEKQVISILTRNIDQIYRERPEVRRRSEVGERADNRFYNFFVASAETEEEWARCKLRISFDLFFDGFSVPGGKK